MLHSRHIFIPPLILSIALIAEGCAVFSTIGDGISQGYENSLTYFNVYYNANREFKDAESQIKAAVKAAEGKSPQGAQPAPIPADAQKNLDLVIDKCSNILAYHSKSSYVDDALMMTGKAFYYKADYSKAERKFLELITQYPNSSLNLEAQLWYAKSEVKLGEYEQARTNLTALIAATESGGKSDVLASSYLIMGSLAARDNAMGSAIEYFEKSAKAADGDQLIGDAWFQTGKLYFDDGQFENCVHASLKVQDYSDDVYQIFRSKLLATQAYRNLLLLDKALALENEMAKDYRFKDFLGVVLLERANILFAAKRYSEAIDMYQALDTTYAKTEAGATADFELGRYFELTGNDYSKARDFYARAITVPATPVLNEASHKVIALNLYFKEMKELSMTDSLLAQASRVDSTGRVADTVASRGKDSSSIAQDSMRTLRVSAHARLNVDSLNAIKARAAASIGELFYTDLANPDSAISWMKYSLRLEYDDQSAPRLLYILSELATSNPDKSAVSSKEYENQLVKDFPKSYFARQIQHLSMADSTNTKVVDSASIAYSVAEGLIDAGKNVEAIAALEKISTRYPASPVVAKSRYAIGWVYENRLAKMDSAAAEYRVLIALYPATPYARAMNARQLDTLAASQAKTDTASRQIQPQNQKKDSEQVGQAAGTKSNQNSGKPSGVLSRRARILQSQHGKIIERE
jgi:tetratricopeptide (TPR) repeat protein